MDNRAKKEEKELISDLYSKLGKRGGEAVYKKYGREHYIRMGKLSAEKRRKEKLDK